MKQPEFIIRDNKAAQYFEPWVAQTVAVGLRRWMENCMNENCMFHKHPGDFTLHERGQYNSETGLSEPYKDGFIDHGTARQMIDATNRAIEAEERETEPAPVQNNAADLVDALSSKYNKFKRTESA